MEETAYSFQRMLYTQLGKRIRELRKTKGLTQAQLADASSLSRTSITNIEMGRRQLPLHTLYNVAFALEKGLDDLLPDLKPVLGTGPLEKIPDGLEKAEHEWVKGLLSSAKKEGEN